MLIGGINIEFLLPTPSRIFSPSSLFHSLLFIFLNLSEGRPAVLTATPPPYSRPMPQRLHEILIKASKQKVERSDEEKESFNDKQSSYLLRKEQDKRNFSSIELMQSYSVHGAEGSRKNKNNVIFLMAVPLRS